MKNAAAVLMGVAAGSSNRRLPRAWFDALAGEEEEVDEMEFDTNARRHEAAVMSKFGMDQ